MVWYNSNMVLWCYYCMVWYLLTLIGACSAPPTTQLEKEIFRAGNNVTAAIIITINNNGNEIIIIMNNGCNDGLFCEQMKRILMVNIYHSNSTLEYIVKRVYMTM